MKDGKLDKVIKGLEHCADRTNKRCNPTCPYHDRDFCNSDLAQDALELLKEQQKERTKEASAYAELNKDTPMKIIGHRYCRCGRCGAMLFEGDEQCDNCGQMIDWSTR